MLYLKVVDADGVEKVEAQENPVFVCMTKNGIYSCEEYYAQGVAALDGSEIYQLYGKESLGLDNGYIALKITAAEYDEWIQTHDQPDPVDPEDDEPVIPDGTPEGEVLTRAQLTERVAELTRLVKTEAKSFTATRTYQTGDIIADGSRVYIADQVIVTGETVRPGINCTETNLAELLSSLQAQHEE